MFLYEKTHICLKNDYQFFDALKTKDHKIRENCNLLTQVKFNELEWSFPSKNYAEKIGTKYFTLYLLKRLWALGDSRFSSFSLCTTEL